LDALSEQAAAARRNSARFVLVTGELGVGKTALVETFGERLAVEGFARQRGSLAQPAGGSPWRAWRRLVAELDPSVAWPRNDASAAECVVDTVIAAARREPLLLVLDDLHRADDIGISPLCYLADLAPPVPLLLVAMVREPPGGPKELTRPDLRLALRGLSPSDAAELTASVAGQPLPDRVVAELTRRCDGNPALLIDLAGRIDAVHVGEQGVQPLVLDWPAEVRAAAQNLLAPLPEEVRNVLAVASVIGREFDLAVLERVEAVTNPIEAIDVALRQGLLTPRPQQVYAFTQALVREVLYDSLGVVRRATLHEATAKALAGFTMPAHDRAPTLGELAHHLVAATVLGGPDRLDTAIAYATAAANAATAAGEYHSATAYQETAVALAIRAQWPAGALGRLTVGLGRALLASGAAARGRATLQGVAKKARHDSDWTLAATAALAHGPRAAIGVAEPDLELIALLRQVIEADLDADLSARATARLAIELVSPATFAEAASVAARIGSGTTLAPRSRAEVLLATAVVSGDAVDADAARRAASEVTDALLAAQIEQVGTAIAWRAGIRPTPSPIDPDGLAHPMLHWWRLSDSVAWLTFEGRLAEAEAALVRARAAGHDLSGDAADCGYAAQLGLIRLLQGRYLELAPLLAELARAGPRLPWLTAMSARLAIDQERPAIARAVLSEALPGTDPAMDPFSAVLLAEVAIEVGDGTAIAALTHGFAALSGQWLVQGPALLCLGAADLWLARLRLAAGDAAAAKATAAKAADLVSDTVWQAQTLVTLAEAQAQSGDTDARLTARTALDAAEWAALGSVAVRARRLIGAPAAALAEDVAALDEFAAAGLTRREREVLELALAGISAKDIATTLFISERTAESHLANIYRKLNVKSRVELLARRPGQPAAP
jgi:DNA-binding CsgD family transcriptional regulator